MTSPSRVSHSMARTEKAAALLLAMDRTVANRLLKHLDSEEVKRFAEAASRLGNLPQHEMEVLVDEFTAAFSNGSDLQGTPQIAEQLLEGIVPSETLRALMADIAGNSTGRVWPALATVPETAVLQFLSKQHPQIITQILSRLSGNQVAALLDQLPVAQRVTTMRRMLTLKEITPVALRILETHLLAEIVSKSSRDSTPDVHARIAAVLNKMSRESADSAFSGLSAVRPKDAEKIKGLLFTFNDITRISDESRTKLFEEIATEITIAALHGATPELQQMVLSVLSQRSKRMIENELQNGRPPSKNEISKAQRAIAERALELLDRGIIEISGDPS